MTGLFETVRNRWAVRQFTRSPLGQALTAHTQRYFRSGEVLSHINEDRKTALVRDFMSKILDVAQSPNGHMDLRNALVGYTIGFCGLSVLCLTEEEKVDQTYAGNPYISGELHHHIGAAAQHNEEMAQFVWEEDGKVSAEQLMSFANQRSALMLYYVNGLNMVRIDSGDLNEPKDWFLPFVEAQMVWEEDQVREKLSLPRLTAAPLHGLPYSTFFNMVLNGDANPFFTWTQKFPELYLAGEGPRPR